MVTRKAEVDILFHCFYMPLGVTGGHPVLSIRWPLTPMPEPEIAEIFETLTFNLGSTNTVLIRDQGMNVIVDPGILQLTEQGIRNGDGREDMSPGTTTTDDDLFMLLLLHFRDVAVQ